MVSGMSDLARIRFWLVVVIVGLVISGLTAFPLLYELNLLSTWLVGAQGTVSWNPQDHEGLAQWILLVREGLDVTYAKYPFIAYGTDWLAFGHLVIALFFLPPWRDPVRYEANVLMGMVACIGVFAVALVCGPLRGIPFYWRLIDCSFGMIALYPLWRVRVLTRKLNRC